MAWKSLAIDSKLYTYEYFLKDYVCRICWCQKGVKEITSKMSEHVATNVTIAEVIYECIGVDLSISERPTKICYSCWNEVKNFSEFKSFCLTTQRKLYDILREGSHRQTESDQNNEDCKSIGDYSHIDANDFLNLELATICEDLRKSRHGKVKPQSELKKVNKKSETYCPLCKTDFESQDSFSQHLITIHRMENSLHKCFGCNKGFKTRRKCMMHERINCKSAKNGFKCNICGMVLQKRINLERHLILHSENQVDFPDEVFECRKCPAEFKSMETLNNHMTAHENKKLVTPGCKTEHNTQEHNTNEHKKLVVKLEFENEQMSTHKKIKFEKPEYICTQKQIKIEKSELKNENMITQRKKKQEESCVCDICGRLFTKQSYMLNHKMTHEGVKNYACSQCDYRTTQKGTLDIHLRRHTGERPYACSRCPHRCVTSSNLRKHMKVHLGIKQFQCKLCDKKFGYKISLQEHMSSVHERCAAEYSCAECGATYFNPCALRRHLTETHGNKLRKSKRKPRRVSKIVEKSE